MVGQCLKRWPNIETMPHNRPMSYTCSENLPYIGLPDVAGYKVSPGRGIYDTIFFTYSWITQRPESTC